MQNRLRQGGWILLTVLLLAAGCIAQKPLDVTFTEGGKGAGIASGLVEKTATATPATISSEANNINQALTVLEFTAKENGSRDGYPFEIKTLRFTITGTADPADLRFILEGPGSNNTVGSVSGSVVTFTDFGNIIVTDGDPTGKTYQLKGQIRSAVNGSTTDGQTIAVSFDPQKDIDVVEASSNIQPNVVSMASGAMAIAITASILQGKSSFTDLVATIGTDFPGNQIVYATDANGRIDLDFTEAITLSAHTTACPNAAPGTLGSTDSGGLTRSAVAGVATWTNLTYNQAAIIRIQAVSPSISSLSSRLCSAAVTINP
ncbi:MAG: hypothetical protein ACOY5B_10855 [Spirochaetota bacterium]